MNLHLEAAARLVRAASLGLRRRLDAVFQDLPKVFRACRAGVSGVSP
jgi:hypothetical protein